MQPLSGLTELMGNAGKCRKSPLEPAAASKESIFLHAVEPRAVGRTIICDRERVVGENEREERVPVARGQVGFNLHGVGDVRRAVDGETELGRAKTLRRGDER